MALVFLLTLNGRDPTGVHGFDLYTDNERTHEIIKKTLEFFKYHLR